MALPPPAERFNAAADDYNRSRPGYPDALLRRLDPPGDTLEIGCGSGQLTVDLVRMGHRVVGVDIGAALLARARQRCPQVELLLERFEDVDLGDRQFDLAVAATAFHWVDPAVGYTKVASLLRPGGRLALLSHRVVAGPLAEELDKVIARSAPDFPLARDRTASTEVERVTGCDKSNISAVLASIEGPVTRQVEAGRQFGRVDTSWVDWDQWLSAAELRAALKATTAWGTIPEQQQAQLQQGLADLVERHGGRFPRRRVTFLVVATVRTE